MKIKTVRQIKVFWLDVEKFKCISLFFRELSPRYCGSCCYCNSWWCDSLFTFHIALHTYYPWLSFISVHCAAQHSLCENIETRSKGLRSKCIARYASLLSSSLLISRSLFIYGWTLSICLCGCMLKSSVSIYVTSVDISLSLPPFILLFFYRVLSIQSDDQPNRWLEETKSIRWFSLAKVICTWTRLIW